MVDRDASHHDETSKSNDHAWQAEAAVGFGIIASLLAYFIFSASLLVFHSILQRAPSSWLPEYVSLIASVDTRVQRWAFLIAAAAFAAMLAAAFFRRPAPPRWLSQLTETVCSHLDPAMLPAGHAWLDRFSRWSIRPPSQRLALQLVGGCLAICLAIFAWGQLKVSIYAGSTLLRVAVSDPHIYSIFGKAGETLAGRFAADPSGQDTAYYGFGPAALYALGRHLGIAEGYSYAYQIARWSNLFAVLVLFWGMFLSRFPRAGHLQTILVLLAASCVAIPLLLPNANSVFTSNLSGLRYVPMLLFIVAVGILPLETRWSSIPILALFAGLGFVYAIDAGIISLIAYIAFVALEDGRIGVKLLRVLAFLTATALVVAVIGALLWQAFSIDLYFSARQILTLANDSFGGVILQFNLLQFVISLLFMVTAATLVFASGGRALDREERFVAAIGVMGFVWYSYYLHRPSRLYWIYPYLALFPLRYWMGRVSNWSTGESRIGAVLTLCVALLITQQTIGGVGRGFAQEHAKRHDTQAAPLSTFSGIKVDATFAGIMNARVQVLDRLGTADAMVITGFPYAMSVASKIATPPRDIVFSMTTTQDIDALVASILAQRPSRLFLEPPDTPAWGPDLMRTVVNRIEKGISGHYTRDEGISEWRVWTVNP